MPSGIMKLKGKSQSRRATNAAGPSRDPTSADHNAPPTSEASTDVVTSSFQRIGIRPLEPHLFKG